MDISKIDFSKVTAIIDARFTPIPKVEKLNEAAKNGEIYTFTTETLNQVSAAFYEYICNQKD